MQDDKYAKDEGIIYKQQHHLNRSKWYNNPPHSKWDQHFQEYHHIIASMNSICRIDSGQSLSCNFPSHLRKIGSLPSPKCNVSSPFYIWDDTRNGNVEDWAEKSFILMWFSIPSFACWSQLIILKWSYLYHLFFTQIHIIQGLEKLVCRP